MNVTFLVCVMSAPPTRALIVFSSAFVDRTLPDQPPVGSRQPNRLRDRVQSPRRLDRHRAPRYRVPLRVRHRRRHRYRVHPVRHRRRLIHLTSETEALNAPAVNVTFLVCVMGVAPTLALTVFSSAFVDRSFPTRRPSAPVTPDEGVIVFKVPVASIVTKLPAIGFPFASVTSAVTAIESTPFATAVVLSTLTSDTAGLKGPGIKVTPADAAISIPSIFAVSVFPSAFVESMLPMAEPVPLVTPEG